MNLLTFNQLTLGECITTDIIPRKVVYQNEDNGYKVQSVEVVGFYKKNEDDVLIEVKTKPFTTVIQGYYDCIEGQKHRLTGEISSYKGENQLIVKEIYFLPPASEKGIIEFLKSSFIKGIGLGLAKKIVLGWEEKDKKTKEVKFINGFGKDTLDIIKNEPELLIKVPGITKKRADSIHLSYVKHLAYQEIVTFFLPYGVTPKQILKIYEEFGGKAIEVANEDPYKFVKIEGFGFKMCDKIALKLGIDPHSRHRIQAATLFTLKNSADTEGHCCVPKEDLVKKVWDLLKIVLTLKQMNDILKQSTDKLISIKIGSLEYSVLSEQIKESLYNKQSFLLDAVNINDIKFYLNEMIENKDVIQTIIRDIDLQSDSTIDLELISLPVIYFTERKTARLIKEASEIKHFDDDIIYRVHDIIDEFENLNNFRLEEQQKNAVVKGVINSFSIITGAAGSGKTTVVNCIHFVLERIYREYKMNFNFMQAAPTGKAAKRMEQASNGKEAKTIHRMLESNGYDFKFNEENPLSYSVIVIDEVSMLDIFLTRALLCSINPNKTKVIFLGDPNQLPSVGAGNVLFDIIESKIVAHTELNVIKRQAEGSRIIENANKIKNGIMIECDNSKDDFYILSTQESDKVLLKTLMSINRFLTHYKMKIDDVQVLVPQRKGPLGSINMNKEIQKLINPREIGTKEIEVSTLDNIIFFRENDKVMHITNSYDSIRYKKENNQYIPLKDSSNNVQLGVFNGDMGVIEEIIFQTIDFDEEEIIAVKYDGFYILYKKEELKNIIHSYALTIHKSQGSQFPVIIMPIHFSYFQKMLYRNLGYTGVTRAQNTVVMIGQMGAIKYMIDTIDTSKRYTLMQLFLKDEI